MDKGKIYNALTFPQRKISNMLDTSAVVLLYHRVKQLATDPLQLAVSPQHFEEHLKHLKSHYNLVTVEEFIFLKKNKKRFPEKTVLLTFDDGYEDNSNEAMPLLEAHNSQALFFITTSNINTDHENWWDDLERIFLEGEFFPAELNLAIKGKSFRYQTSSVEKRRQIYWSLLAVLKFVKPDERNSVIHQLYEWKKTSVTGRATHRMMTKGELKKLASSKSVVVGAHTLSHASLACQTYVEQLDEIKRSKDFLESLTGKRVVHFAYPFGTRKDFNKTTIEACVNIGLEMTFVNYYGQVHRRTHNYKIPRMLVRDWDTETFKEKMKSFFRY